MQGLSDVIKGLGGAAMYQFTDRVFEHFLTAVMAVVLSGRITLDEGLEIMILIVLVYLAVELHKHVDGGHKAE